MFDRDNDGFISQKELSLLIRSLERNPTDNEIQHLIENLVNKGSYLSRFLIFVTIDLCVRHKNETDGVERERLTSFFRYEFNRLSTISSNDVRFAT